MPTYAYACKNCENAFDAVQSFSEPSLTECPACGGALRKVYGTIGVTFNGGGFYRTDSRAASGTASGASTSASSTPAPSSSTGASAPAPASA